MSCEIPFWPALPASVQARFTTRTKGVSQGAYGDGLGSGGFNLGLSVGDERQAVLINRTQLRQQLPAEPFWLRQVHGTHVLDATCDDPETPADASVSDKVGVVCIVQTADCLPVLLADSKGQVVGAAHAGWRGLAAGVLENTAHAMRKRGAQEIVAWLGAAIGPQCFEVGEEVRGAFIKSDHFVFVPQKSGKYLTNLYQLARQALVRSGVENIAGGGDCTYFESSRYYSYRRNSITGRMASLIWKNQ